MISVIIPVYNVEKYLIECVKSIQNQTYQKLEIILIDDGSTDSSGKLCDNLAESDPRIIVIHKKNGGLSSSRNMGLNIASGKYISFIDSDDYIESNMFEEMIKKFIDHPNLDIVSCYFDTFIDGTKEFKPFFKYKKDNLFTNIEYLKLIFQHKLDNAVCNKIYKRSSIKDIRFIEGKINEDILFNVSVLINSNYIYYLDNAFYKYRQREGSITHKINPKQFDFVENSFEVCKLVKENSLSILSSCAKAYSIYEIVNYIIVVLLYDTKGVHKDNDTYCRNYLKSNILKSLLNRNLNVKYKCKLLFLLYFPTIYIKIRSINK